MTLYTKKRFSTTIFTLIFEFIVFILSSSFTEKKSFWYSSKMERINNYGLSELQSEYSLNTENKESNFIRISDGNNSISNVEQPYFPLIYSGFGVDHMNINIVNLLFTGLNIGDEIGVFDGNYCVGSAIVEEKNLKENGLSIPASANENNETKPNGYIEGHKITLKAYRSGVVFLLYFQTVNNSTDIFERWGSMFALVDFSRSEKENPSENSFENPKIYPNPFETSIRIEVNLSKNQPLNCEIFDVAGRLIKTIYMGMAEGQQLLIWDGKDNRMHPVSAGFYLCRVNGSTTKIIYLKQ